MRRESQSFGFFLESWGNFSESIYMSREFWDTVLSEIGKRKWTQKELAQLSGVSRTVINNGIGHHHTLLVDNAFKIAKALGTSVEVMISTPRLLPNMLFEGRTVTWRLLTRIKDTLLDRSESCLNDADGFSFETGA